MGRAQSCRPQSAESAFRRRMAWRDGAGDGWSGGVTVKAHHRKMFVPGPHGRSHPLHEYATCSMTQEANVEGALGARARWTASYHRIMADQPLPSTAADLAARATSLQGPSLEAAVRRAEVSEQIRSWNLFAAQYEAEHAKNAGQPTPRPRHGTSCASTRRDWNGSNKTMHCIGQAMDSLRGKGDTAQLHRRMFQALGRHQNSHHGDPESLSKDAAGGANAASVWDRDTPVWLRRGSDQRGTAEGSSDESHAGKVNRVLKTRRVKRQEMVEAQNKLRNTIQYKLPEGHRLMSSDQSAVAARTSIKLTALEIAEENENSMLRKQLWALMKFDGAVPEDKKAMARDALMKADMEAVTKIIKDAERRKARLEARAFMMRNVSNASNTASNTPAQSPMATRSMLQRPETARPPSKTRGLTKVRPATASQSLSSLSDVFARDTSSERQDSAALNVGASSDAKHDGPSASSDGDGTTNQTPPSGFEVCNRQNGSPSSDEGTAPFTTHVKPPKTNQQGVDAPTGGYKSDSELSETVNDDPEVADCQDSSEAKGAFTETADSFKTRRIKSEKLANMQRWLSLGDSEADEIVAHDRVALPNNRLSEVPQYFLAADLKVRIVNLTKNRIEALPDKFCIELVHLQECNLSHNMLTSLPQSIWQMKNLEKLLLNDNQLRGLPFGIGYLHKLRLLNIEKNRISRLPCSFCGADNLATLSTRGNPAFSSPPQSVMDSCLRRTSSGEAAGFGSIDRIRQFLRKVFLAGEAVREEIWDTLHTRNLTVPALLMAIVGTDISTDWDVKHAGRPADLSFTKEHMYEVMRWEMRVLKSKQQFKDLWEFLDEDGNGKLTHRQFLYQMKWSQKSVAVQIQTSVVVHEGDPSEAREKES